MLSLLCLACVERIITLKSKRKNKKVLIPKFKKDNCYSIQKSINNSLSLTNFSNFVFSKTLQNFLSIIFLNRPAFFVSTNTRFRSDTFDLNSIDQSTITILNNINVLINNSFMVGSGEKPYRTHSKRAELELHILYKSLIEEKIIKDKWSEE